MIPFLWKSCNVESSAVAVAPHPAHITQVDWLSTSRFWEVSLDHSRESIIFVVTIANIVELLLSSFQHQVRRVLAGLVLRHRKSKSAQVKTGKQGFSLTEYNR